MTKKGHIMPIVRINMFPGRSEEQKERLAETIAQAMHDIAGSNKAGVHVVFEEVEVGDWYQGGRMLGEDRRKETGTV